MEPRRNFQFDPFASGAEAYDNDDLDLDSIDYNDPASLFGTINPNMPVPDYMSPENVRREAERRSKNIFASYEALRSIILRHEATIQNRWLKKKKHQRLNILLSAWPGMVTVHRPDFDAFRKGSKEPGSKRKYRDHYLWPYINQEDLLVPKALLLMLNSRGRHYPSCFAAADCEAMHLGMVTTGLVPIFLNQHTMVLNGADNAKAYGKLLHWDSHPEAFDWLHTLKQFPPGEGILVLEAQEKVLAFLVDCCRQILHDIPADSLTTDAFPIQPEPHLKTESETNGFESLAVMAAEAPYRLPAKLDLDRIESLLGAKASAAEDHIWALREDPAYFAQCLLETKEHRQEMLKDIVGDGHPVFRGGREGTLWARISGDVIVNAYFELEVFSELRQQAEKLKSLQAEHAAAISPTKDLPDDLLEALLRFRHFLNQAAKGPLNQLKHLTVASPPMRKFFVRQPPADPNSSMIQTMQKPGVKMNKVETQLIWLLRTLWEDGHSLFLVRLPLALDELDRLLEAEPEAQELTSALIAKIIGNLAIVSQCVKQLELYQPWARSFETGMAGRQEELGKEYQERTKPWAKMLSALGERNISQAAKQADPSNKRFFYPSEKRQIKENVEAMRLAERNLDEFWATVDRIVHVQCGDDLRDTAVRQLLLQPRILQRTTEWLDGPKVTAKGKERVSNLQVDAIYKPLSTLYFGQTGASTSKQTTLPVRTKTKTKGPAPEATPETITTDIVAEATPERPSIPVDARSLKVFRNLFFNPAVTSSPGEVSWTDFLHAMTSTGKFTAEKLYGSVWQFQKVDGSDQSRIQFHEPHPRGKIPFVMARRHGRRLTRAFGWVGEMFVLKEN